MNRSMKIGFFGLGAMGYPIAGNLSKIFQVYVWNRTLDKSEKHAAEYGTTVMSSMDMCTDMDYVFTCLPTSRQVSEVLSVVHPYVSKTATFIDITSGDIESSIDLSDRLMPNRYLDAPVSGGPSGASQGTLTSMVGGRGSLSNADLSVFGAYSAKIVECGGVGHGNAIKAANNFLNVSHLILGSDILIQLKRAGVSTEAALSAINASSGRSLQTEVRIPKEVMTRQFNYGFKLNLMRKDVLQGEGLLKESMFYDGVSSLLRPHEHNESDYTSIVRDLEIKNNTKLP
jgi:3-hydroxyisobutyrate dehydrogenase